ncbi:MAG: FAD-dependent oxidoreductase [Opitutales bacterium]
MSGKEGPFSYDVLILGGGFAGVAVAQRLGRHARRRGGLRAALVSSENYMVFQPMLAEVAAASISPSHVVNPLRQLCKGVDVYRGKVTSIDGERREVQLEPSRYTPNVLLRGEELVLALGARIDLRRVPGMSEHAFLMQNVGDAMKLRSKIIERFEEANLVTDATVRRRLLTFVVVGGGYSGVETAGEILDLLRRMVRFYENVSPEEYEVVLVHSREVLLPTLSPSLGRYAAEKLEARGLRLLLGHRVRVVTANYVTLDNGDTIASNTVVSTVGTAPLEIVAELIAKHDLAAERGRIRTTNTFAVEGLEGFWAAGDCAVVPKVDGGDCPPTAQFATRQGEVLARNLLARRAGRPPKPFTFTGLGELAAIGHHTAVAEIKGRRFSGFFAWWMWRTIYLSKLPGFQRKLHVLIDWTFDLFFPRDINLLNPDVSRQLKEIHLEPGDVLFNPGEPAFSLYFVQRGRVEIRKGNQLIKTASTGEYFGERALLEDRIWRFHAIATEPSQLIALDAPEFLTMVEGSTALRTLFERSAKAYLPADEVAAIRQLLAPETLAKPADAVLCEDLDLVRPEMSLEDALELFRAHRHGSYPVVDADHKPLGVVKRDALFDRLKSAGTLDGATVRDLPFAVLPIVPSMTPCSTVLDVMRRSGRNKILVTDDHDRLVGLVTIMDLLDDSVALNKDKQFS